MALERTAEAVRAFDRATDSEKKPTFLAIREALRQDTGRTCLNGDLHPVSPNAHNGYLRRLLRNTGHEGCVLTSEERRQLGWDW